MESLKDRRDQLFSSPLDMARLAREFYFNLYTDTPCDSSALSSLGLSYLPTISSADQIQLDRSFTSEEMLKAAQTSKHGTCPGPDGLPVELYLEYWEIFSPIFTQLPGLVLSSGSFSNSQCEAQISLLYKKGDKATLANWRPISLLNSDYKIISCALASRLSTVLPKLISPAQHAFVPDRWIGNAIANMELAINLGTRQKKTMATAILDFQKAYDTISHTYLKRVLKQYGFGQRFYSLLCATTVELRSSIQFNGWTTSPIPLSSGIRQGDPLAPLLYVLALEPLCACLHRKLVGFRLGVSRPLTTIAYADDLSIIIRSGYEAQQVALLLKLFEQAGGGRINYGKSKLFLNGPCDSITSELPFIIQKPPFQYLGVQIGGNLSTEEKEVEERFRKRVNGIYLAGLPLRTKCWLLNTYLTSKLVYLDQFHPLPDQTLERLQKLLITKIWDGGPRLLKAEVVLTPVHKGGLGLINLKDKLQGARAKWVLRLTRGRDEFWIASTRFLAHKASIPYRHPKYIDGHFRQACPAWTARFTSGLDQTDCARGLFPLSRWQAAMKAIQRLHPAIITTIRRPYPLNSPVNDIQPLNLASDSFQDKDGNAIQLDTINRTHKILDTTSMQSVHGLEELNSGHQWKCLIRFSFHDSMAANTLLLYMHGALLTVDRLSPDWVLSHSNQNLVQPLNCPLCKDRLESNQHLVNDCEFFQKVWRKVGWPTSWTRHGPDNDQDFIKWGLIIHGVWDTSRNLRYHAELWENRNIWDYICQYTLPRAGLG